MYKSTLSAKFKTIASATDKRIDLVSSVRTPYSYIKLVPTGDDRAAGLAYTFAPYFNAKDVIAIDNSSSEVRENRERVEVNFTRVYNSRNFKIAYKNFLLTHVFKTTEAGIEPSPLFWMHTLVDSADDIDLTTIKILDSNLNEVSKNTWEMESLKVNSDDIDNSVVLYNNLESYFDEVTGEYEVFYVVYTKVNGEYNYSLLNNSPIYQQKTLDNIRYAFLYNSSNLSASAFYDVDISGSVGINQLRFAVQPSMAARIYTKLPLNLEADSSWTARINNGRFRRINTFGTTTRYYTYYISEFSDQPFAPMEPYRRYSRMEAKVLNNNLLYTETKPITFGGSFNVDIIVKDKSDNLRFALTSDVAKTYYVDYDPVKDDRQVVQYTYVSTDYLSIDQLGGFLYLGPYTVNLDDQVYLNLYRTEDSYDLLDVELNPSLNPDILEQVLIIFIVPEVEGTAAPAESVMWLLLDSEGEVVDWADSPLAETAAEYINDNSLTDWIYNYTASGVVHQISEELDIEIVTVDGEEVAQIETSFPVLEADSVVISGTTGLDTANLTVSGTTITIPIIGDSYSVSGTATVSYQFEAANANQYLLLSEIASRPSIAPHELSVFDIRELGGGIIPSKVDEVTRLNEEVSWYWDIGYWDAMPVPAMATERIDIPWFFRPPNDEDIEPEELTTHSFVTEAIAARQALGNYSLRNVWGPQPTIINFDPFSTAIKIELSDEDHDTGMVRYYVQYTTTPNNPDSYSTAERIESADRVYTITGLKRNTSYALRCYCTASLDSGLTWQRIPNDDIIKIKTRG